MDKNEKKEIAPSNEVFQFSMGLNDNKAGMEGLDKEKINKIIMDATKGSRFYDNELKKDQQVNQRIEKMMLQKAQLTSQQIKKTQVQVDRLALELERRRDLTRVIVHIDMDAFYAAVEMRDNPELKSKPMAVGSMSMLSTSNYLARRFGVRAAMPGFIGKKLCPNLTIVPLNFDKYRAVSSQVREILADYDPNFLPLSLDEAYLDITDHLEERLSWPEEKRRYFISTGNVAEEGALQGVEIAEQEECTSPVLFDDSPPVLMEQHAACTGQDNTEVNGNQQAENVIVFGLSAEEAVKEMRFRIEQKTTLTASAGIAPNMMLAKVCSDKNKPNGQYLIPHERQAVMDFIKDLPIRKVPGIGKVTEKMLKALGITTCTDLYQQRALLSLMFSEISWHNFLNISMGLGSTHIERDGERKSMSTERTFSEMSATEEQFELCRELCKDLAQDLRKEGLKGKTVTLKLKNVKFEVKTRASTVTCGVSTEEEIFSVAKEILRTEIDSTAPEPLRLRLMGVRVSGFLPEEDKKHQKSITSFLCPSKATSSSHLESPSKATSSSHTTAPARQSFFNQKRAARQFQSQNVCMPITGATHTIQNGNLAPSDDKMEVSVAETESQKADFTCPICFIKQSSWDLKGFNEHIDTCLSRTPVSCALEILRTGENIPSLVNKKCSDEDISDFDVGSKKQRSKMVDVRNVNDLDSGAIHEIRDVRELGKSVQMDHNHCALSETGSKGSGNMLFGSDAEPMFRVDNKGTSEPGPSLCLTAAMFICPVCNVKQDTANLAEFNRHVDVCLNKGIIEELKVETIGPRKSPALPSLQQRGNLGRGNQSNNSMQRTKRAAASTQNPVSKKPKPNCPAKSIERFFK
ncbi:DNA polymerase kappa isoform 2-T2 [Pelodytes ibericus]